MKYSPTVNKAQRNLWQVIILLLPLMMASSLTSAQNERQPKTSKEYFNRALAHERRGDFDRAIQDYNQAISIEPDNADAYNNRGLAYLEKRKFDRAVQDFTKLISLKPKEGKAYFNRGLAHLEKGALDPAIQDFSQAISLDLDLDRTYQGRAQAYRKLGKNDLADADERKAQELSWKAVLTSPCKQTKPTVEIISRESAVPSATAVDSKVPEQAAIAMIGGLQYAGLRLEKKIRSYSVIVEMLGVSAGKMAAGSYGSRLNDVLTMDEFQYVLLAVDNAGLDHDRWVGLWINELRRLNVAPRDNTTGIGMAIRATPMLIDLNRREFRCVNNELVAVRNLKRLRNISPELLRTWHSAISRHTTNVNDLVLIHLITAQDALFDGSNLQQDRAQRELDKLLSLPTESVKAWGEATGYSTIDAAFSLLSVQSLFSSEAFMKDRFDAALPLAQKSLTSRSSP